jgi:hypothetical protein
VVNFLVGLHACEELGLNVVVGPAEVEGEVLNGISLQVPAVLFGNVLHDCVLGF